MYKILRVIRTSYVVGDTRFIYIYIYRYKQEPVRMTSVEWGNLGATVNSRVAHFTEKLVLKSGYVILQR